MTKKKLRFLIADDYVDNRKLLQEIVNVLGHEYTAVKHGEAAIEKLKEETFDIVLMDIEMPVMNGIEATHEIRTTLPPPLNNIPVVAISAHSQEHFDEKFKTVGFNDFLAKPYSIPKLLEIIDTHVK